MSQGPRRHQTPLGRLRVSTLALAVTSTAVMAVGLMLTVPWLAAPFAGAVQGPTPDERSLRELIEALLPPTTGGHTVRLLPGQMPPNLPLEVPLPPGSRLVGSIVRTSGPVSSTEMTIAPVATTEIAFDAPGSAEELLAFFDRTLAPQGWHDIQYRGSSNGFLPNLAVRSRSYCSDDSDHAVGLTINPSAEGPHDVRLHVSRATMFSACVEPWRSRGASALSPGGSFSEPFPTLYAPAEARLGMGDRSSQYGGGGGQQQIAIETTLGVDELGAWYGDQMRAAGWTRQAANGGAGFAWSTWRLLGEEEWEGLLFVLEGAVPEERWLYLRIETAAPAPRGLRKQEG